MDNNSEDLNIKETYCICKQVDGDFMIECTAENPKCNGWIHPECFHIEQSEIDKILKMNDYVCPMDRTESMEQSYQDYLRGVDSNISNEVTDTRSTKNQKMNSYNESSYSDENRESEQSFQFSSEDSNDEDSDYQFQKQTKKSSKSSVSTSKHLSKKSKHNHPWSESESDDESESEDEDDDNEEEEEESERDDEESDNNNNKRKKRTNKHKYTKPSGSITDNDNMNDDEEEEYHDSDKDSNYNNDNNSNVNDNMYNTNEGNEDELSSSTRHSRHSSNINYSLSNSHKHKKTTLRQLEKQLYKEMNQSDTEDSYKDELDEDIESSGSPYPSEQSKIEKILGRRFLLSYYQHKDDSPIDSSYPEDAFEYLVKWRDQSYLHVSWTTVDILNQDNPPHGHNKLLRFIKQLPVDGNNNIIEYPPNTNEEEFFQPSYLTVDKVLSSTDTISYDPEEYWQINCRNILNIMFKAQQGGVTLATPLLNIDSIHMDDFKLYSSLIDRPIDLCTIRKRLMATITHRRKQKPSTCNEDNDIEESMETTLLSDENKNQFSESQGIPLNVSAPSPKTPVSSTSVSSQILYNSFDEFDKDIQLLFDNSEIYYNDEHAVNGSDLKKKCKQLKSVYNDNIDSFIEDYQIILDQYTKKQELERNQENNQIEKKYLIKWEDLSYADITWEKESDINDDIKISQYERRERVPLRKKNPMFIPGKTKLKNLSFKLPPFKENKTLRPYQVEGYRWMANNYINNKNSILADEMGLGKTIQVISLMQYIVKVLCVSNPIIVIAPLSTLGFWKREIESWTTLDVCYYHDIQGGKDIRKTIQEYEWYYKYTSGRSVGQRIPGIYKFDVLICTYEIALTDFEDISTIPFSLLVVDEAQRLKGQQSKLQTYLKQMKWSQCVLLTGTPLQNNMSELWTLLQFVAPRVIPPLNVFLDKFGDLKNQQQVQSLQTILQEYILRRLKENVEDSIPRKEETIIDIELTTLQKAYYRAIYEHNRDFLTRGYFRDGHAGTFQVSTQFRGPTLLNMEIQLRKCCNHPYLLEGTEERENEGLSIEDQQNKLISSSGKMVLLDKLLAKLKEEGHRVLLFSQFTCMLDIVEKYLKFKQYTYERIDGSIRGNLREKAIQHYNEENSDVFVFLLSTRAGGVGITLTSADTVIIFDSDWNPQNDVQAQARCHRIGQTKSVRIYRLITKNTYETIMFDRASHKLGLEQAVMSTRKNTSNENLEILLKEGAYAQLLEENTDKGTDTSKIFCESNIDELLEKQSRVISYDNDNTAPTLFTKTSFASTTSDTKLDVHDPEFWNKVFGEDHRDTILTRLEDGTVIKSQDAKEKFLNELSDMSNEMIALRLNGDYLPTWCDLLGGVLKQIQGMKQNFSETQRNRCYKLLQEIDKPRRKRKTIQPTPDLSYLDSENEDEETNKKNTSASNEELCYICLKTGIVYATNNTENDDGSNNSNESLVMIPCRGTCGKYYHICCIEDPPEVSEYGEWKCIHCQFDKHVCNICQKEGDDYEKSSLFTENGKHSKTQHEDDNDSSSNSSSEDEEDDINKEKKNKLKLKSKKSINTNMSIVVKCAMRNCCRYYHLKCVNKEPLTNKSHFTDQTKFRCPSHYCCVCSDTGNNKQLLTCVWCCNAIHASCFTSSKGLRLSKKYYLCNKHKIPTGITSWKPNVGKRKVVNKVSPTVSKTTHVLETESSPVSRGTKGRKPVSSKSTHVSRSKQQHDESDSEVSESSESQTISIKNESYTNKEKPSTKRQRGTKRSINDEKDVVMNKKDKNKKIKLETSETKSIDPGLEYTLDKNETIVYKQSYKEYKGKWCRYCGTRTSSKFFQGPHQQWLCVVHFILWKKNKINLTKWNDKPITKPYFPKENTHLKYLHFIKGKKN